MGFSSDPIKHGYVHTTGLVSQKMTKNGPCLSNSNYLASLLVLRNIYKIILGKKLPSSHDIILTLGPKMVPCKFRINFW